MKKTTFYSMVRENTGATIALQQKGYTDGTYYYYKKDSLWLVIHPANGLSICSSHTRKEAAARAHEPRFFVTDVLPNTQNVNTLTNLRNAKIRR